MRSLSDTRRSCRLPLACECNTRHPSTRCRHNDRIGVEISLIRVLAIWQKHCRLFAIATQGHEGILFAIHLPRIDEVPPLEDFLREQRISLTLRDIKELCYPGNVLPYRLPLPCLPARYRCNIAAQCFRHLPLRHIEMSAHLTKCRHPLSPHIIKEVDPRRSNTWSHPCK